MRTELDAYLKSVNARIPEKYNNYDDVKAKALHQKRINEMLPNLEKQRKDFLKKDFKPNEDWYNSSLTKD